MKPSSRQALAKLEDAFIPLDEEELEVAHQKARARRLYACLSFKDYIWAIMALILMIALVVRVGFGIVNIVNAFEPINDSVALSASFTAIAGGLLALFILIDVLYVFKFIGCKDFDFTPEEVAALNRTERAYFEPGCFYDSRIIENRIDVNMLRFFLPAMFVLSMILYWAHDSFTTAPSKATPEGVRYVITHLILLGIESMSIMCIVSNLYSLWRRRPKLETLRVDFWFEIKRHWEEDERTPLGPYLQ